MLDISNYYEQLVIDQLWKLNEGSSEPLTRAFLEDVACLVLNQLPPCYVRNAADKSANLTESQYTEMMDAASKAIRQAIELVHRRPHDDRET
ncbi:MAG: late competence development ComFB family protein [Methylomicrobium sp.]|nr:late competence development ComFB family protein [Methylomicrobium sp.]